MLLCSCASWQGKDGSRSTVVLGIGVLREHISTADTAAVAQTGIVGLAIRGGRPNAGITLGLRSELTVEIPSGWQGIISVKAGKPVAISSPVKDARF